MALASTFKLLKTTASDWSDDKAARLAAALSFYTLLSLAPLLVLVVSIAGLVFGADAARGQITGQLQAVMGKEGGEAVRGILANAHSVSSGVIGTIVGVVILLVGAAGVFGELQSALNDIWEVEPKPGRGWKGMLRDRFFSLSMVFGVAFLLLVSLVFSAAVSALGGFFTGSLPGGEVLWHVIELGVSFVVTTVLFALIFKVVPDVKITWKDVWIGALATALLFTLGKFLIGLYLGHSTVASPFGAAGSVVALVIWVYYSTQILFFGAEFTQVYARTHGSRIQPADNAKPVEKPPAKSPEMPAASAKPA